MKITIIGTGYVGLVTGACFSEMGNHVTCVDIDQKKLDNLAKGILPIYEPGLEAIVLKHYQEGLLSFSNNLKEAMQESNIYFIAVGTPPGEDGSADLQYVLSVAREIGKNITQYSVIVDKSTVPVGTAEKVTAVINEELIKRNVDIEFDVVSNPEFLKEGAAVDDFMKPDRIIVGTASEKAGTIMKRLYKPFSRNHEKLIIMGIRDAEMTKYAANSLLATKISFINEIANICERMDVDVENVRRGIGSDSRIGYSFIYPGCGYGGSCFPKDIKALIRTSKMNGFEPVLLEAVETRNQFQKNRLFEKIIEKFENNIAGKTFGIWGLSFKPDTDDMREASSVILVEQLVNAGALVKAYDPVAMEEAEHVLGKHIENGQLQLCTHQYEAIKNVAALIVVTEWKIFRQPDFTAMKKMMTLPIIFDGRNVYEPEQMKQLNFYYNGIGRQ